jgi:hypothetical protein
MNFAVLVVSKWMWHDIILLSLHPTALPPSGALRHWRLITGTTQSASIIGGSLVSMDTSSTQLHDVPARHLLFRQVFLTSSYKFRTYTLRLRALNPPLPSRYTSSPITERLQES